MKSKVLIFGAGGVGVKAKQVLEAEGYEVIAFSDNNEDKWGGKIEGCSIISPRDINVELYDYYAVGLYKAAEIVKNQLMKMGVEEDRILFPVKPCRISKNECLKYEKKKKGEKIVVVLEKEIFANQNEFELIDCWDLENNFWAFHDLIDEILFITNNKGINWWKEHNITGYDCLKLYFYKIIGDKKIDKNESILVVSDDVDLQHLVYSKNTLKFWKCRMPRNFDEVFLKKIDFLKKTLDDYNIPLEEMTIVSGAILQAYGLRDEKFADDIDIVMTDRFRELYGRKLVIVSESAEMHPQNEMKLGVKNLNVSDDDIINDENLHFYFRGVKFCILELLYEHRCYITNLDEVKIMEWFGCKH